VSPSPGAFGPASRLRRRYADAPADALLTGLGAAFRSREVAEEPSHLDEGSFAHLNLAAEDRIAHRQLPRQDARDGVVVTEVENGSISQSFVFQRGDIVVSVNNTKIAVMQDLLGAISQPVRPWRLTILRGGQEISAVFGG
jgi:C-terminal processing protease CtpA/Prc